MVCFYPSRRTENEKLFKDYVHSVSLMSTHNVSNKHLYIEKLCCSKETKDMIMRDCIEVFFKENPKLRGIKVTQNMILYRIAEFYIKG